MFLMERRKGDVMENPERMSRAEVADFMRGRTIRAGRWFIVLRLFGGLYIGLGKKRRNL
jgi:hypothetical protein